MNWFVSLRANPLVLRSIRQPARLSAWHILRIGVAAALVGAMLCSTNIASRHNTILTSWVFLAAAVMMIATPPFLAYTASNFTLHELHSEQYQLVHVTALSNARLIEGYIFAALYGSRLLLLLIAGFTPFLILGGMLYAGYTRCNNSYLPMLLPGCESIPLPEAPALWLLTCVLIFVCFAGMVLLAVVFGVLLAVAIQIGFIANLAALLVTLIGTVAAAGWVLGLRAQPLPAVFQKAAVLSIAVFLTGFLLLRLARPFARKRI